MNHLVGAANLPSSEIEVGGRETGYIVGHVRCTADGVLVLCQEPHHLDHSIDLSSAFQMSQLPRVADLLEEMAFRDPPVGIHLVVCTDGDEWERFRTYILLTLCRLFSIYASEQLNAPPPIVACDRLDVLEEFARLQRYFALSCRLALYVHDMEDWEYLLTESKVPFVDYVCALSIPITGQSVQDYHTLGYLVICERGVFATPNGGWWVKIECRDAMNE